MANSPITLAIFGLYIVALFAITIYTSKDVNDQADFLAGGKNIGWLGTALSACASSNSAGTMIGHAGCAYLQGLSFHWCSLGIVLFESLNMFVTMAPRMRNISGHRNVLSIADYYRARFKSCSTMLQATSAIIIVAFMISYLVAQIKGMSFTITNVLGWNFATGVIVASVIVLVYTILGGYVAVVWTDVIQGLMMMFAMIVLPAILMKETFSIYGGWTGFMDFLSATPSSTIVAGEGSMASLCTAGLFLSVLGNGTSNIGSTGNPHIIQRYITVANRKEAARGGLMVVIFSSIVTYGAVYIGLFGRALMPDPATLVDSTGAANSEMIFLTMAKAYIGSDIILGLLYAAVFAAIMSTVDSMLLIVSSAACYDIYQGWIKKGAEVDTKKMLTVNRVTVVVVILVAMVGVFFAPSSIFVLGLFAWSGVGGAIGPPIIMSLWFPRVNGYGAVAGMIGGCLTACAFQFVPALSSIIYGMLPAFIVSAALTYFVSLATPADNDPDLVKHLTTTPPDILAREAAGVKAN